MRTIKWCVGYFLPHDGFYIFCFVVVCVVHLFFVPPRVSVGVLGPGTLDSHPHSNQNINTHGFWFAFSVESVVQSP